MERPTPKPMNEQPEEPGWYPVLWKLPADTLMATDYWNGTKWRRWGNSLYDSWINKNDEWYPVRFYTEDDADEWVKQHDRV